MTETLTRPKPRIDHPEELERMVRQIVERVDPVAIYLFGSQIKVSCELLPQNLPFRDRFERLHRFTIFAFTFRYPGDAAPEPEPTASDTDAWVPGIEDLKADFERRLEQRAGEPG